MHLGVDMDSRVFRIDPPTSVRWFDVDFPDVIELRRQVYPERAGTTMVGASVTDPAWRDVVPRDRPALVVAEGLSMYLEPADGHALFRRVVEHFPNSEVFFDAYSTLGIRVQKANGVVRRAKATLRWGIGDPHELAAVGLTPVSRQSAEAFVPREDWPHLPVVPHLLCRAVLRLPRLRNLGQLPRYRFGS